MKFLLFFLIPLAPIIAQDMPFDQKLFDTYDSFKEPTITDRRFKHKDIQPLIKRLEKAEEFAVKVKGQSIEGRSISVISYGRGKTNVLLWSQMHGDEPTATMALFDIFNFLINKDDFRKFKNVIQEELTIHFIPMLNPDGAERYKRRNAVHVDLNRDALRLQCPESQLLKAVRDEVQADWGFNLHDQNRYYAAGQNPHTASISFLAPAYNYEKEVNETRANSMQLILEMNDVLQKHIPNKVARYSDEFEPRAFGDNIQKWGTSTILIESGGLENDREKQFLRKLHYVAILSAFKSIAEQAYKKRNIAEYDQIPFNDSNSFNDLILRKANVSNNGKTFVLDIAFRHNEQNTADSDDYYFDSNVQDIGDLSTQYGYEEFDASDYILSIGKAYPKKIKSIKQLGKLNLIDLLKAGYTYLIIKEDPKEVDAHQLPISLVQSQDEIPGDIATNVNPSLLLRKNGKVKAVLINGFIHELDQDRDKMLEAWEKFLQK